MSGRPRSFAKPNSRSECSELQIGLGCLTRRDAETGCRVEISHSSSKPLNECNGDFTPVIKVPPISSGLTGMSAKGLDPVLSVPCLLVSGESHAAFFGYGSFGARPRAHRRNKPAGIGRRRVPRDRPPGCQPFVVSGAVQRLQHQSERMAAIRCYIGASRASRSCLFSAELPGRG